MEEDIKIVIVLVDPMKVHTHPEVNYRHQIPMTIQRTLPHIVHQVLMEVHTIAHQTAHMEDPTILIIQDHLIHQIHHQTLHQIHQTLHQNKKEDMVDLGEVEEDLEDKEVRKDSEKNT